jgi:membrane protein DedA with SNARE-associated domain
MNLAGMLLILLAGIFSVAGNLEPSPVLGWVVTTLLFGGYVLVNVAQRRKSARTDAAISEFVEAGNNIRRNPGKYIPGAE